jgi:hypothetical protein
MAAVRTRSEVIPVDSEERCELTELIKTQCAHCRAPRRPHQPQFVEAVFAPTPDKDDVIVATFQAQWPGKCAECGDYFPRNATVSRTRAGDLLHVDCAT